MLKITKRKVYIAAAGLAVCFLMASVLNVRLWAQSDQKARTCKHRQPIAHGDSPSGTPWTVTVSIRENGHNCSAWLLGFEFRPDQKPYSHSWEAEAELSRQIPMPGSFSWGWGIPAGGHLPNDFTISGQDEYEGSERVFAGAAGGSVKSITLTMSSGKHMVIHPRLPGQALRQRFVWLRNLRYFVSYYHLGSHVQKVAVRSANGVSTIRGNEGAFEKIGLTGL
ncbi:MAG: hypothetical protein QOF13_651 [Solirubrobacterales bacterium]|jgi:hypothetical protein|nr:hypothetical protein [Solirubrobacterales bacterium]